MRFNPTLLVPQNADQMFTTITDIQVPPTVEERVARSNQDGYYLAICQALTILESHRPRRVFTDEAMRKIIARAGAEQLIAYAKSHHYEHYSGLVRLGFCTRPSPAEESDAA